MECWSIDAGLTSNSRNSDFWRSDQCLWRYAIWERIFTSERNTDSDSIHSWLTRFGLQSELSRRWLSFVYQWWYDGQISNSRHARPNRIQCDLTKLHESARNSRNEFDRSGKSQLLQRSKCWTVRVRNYGRCLHTLQSSSLQPNDERLELRVRRYSRNSSRPAEHLPANGSSVHSRRNV